MWKRRNMSRHVRRRRRRKDEDVCGEGWVRQHGDDVVETVLKVREATLGNSSLGHNA
jgi:hypothetical protein